MLGGPEDASWQTVSSDASSPLLPTRGSRVKGRTTFLGLGHTKNVCCTPLQHTQGKQHHFRFSCTTTAFGITVSTVPVRKRKGGVHLDIRFPRCSDSRLDGVPTPSPNPAHACLHAPLTHTPTRGISRALQLVMIGFGAKPHTKHRHQGPSRIHLL